MQLARHITGRDPASDQSSPVKKGGAIAREWSSVLVWGGVAGVHGLLLLAPGLFDGGGQVSTPAVAWVQSVDVLPERTSSKGERPRSASTASRAQPSVVSPASATVNASRASAASTDAPSPSPSSSRADVAASDWASGTPAPGPAVAPAPSAVRGMTDELTLPSQSAAYLNNPPPSYPAISKRLGEQGRVVIRVHIDERGMPKEAQFETRSGYSRLDQAAMDAVMSWRYTPARRNGVALAMWFNVPITFDLKQ